jgi:hypothetical protein
MLAAGLLLLPSSALALETHPLTGSFGPDGTTGTSFANVQGVAVDQTSGNVYVYDTGEGKVYKFDSAGNPVNFSSTGTNAIEGVGGAGAGENQLAVAPAGAPGGTAGDIYVAKYPAVVVYGPDGALVGELTSEGACGVATDPAGHVFAGVYPRPIKEYIPTANAPFAAEKTGESTAPFPGSCNIAVDGLGNVYAADYEGTVITKLEGIEDDPGTPIKPGVEKNSLAIDPANNDLYADRGSEVAQYSSTGTLLRSFGSGVLTGSHGVGVSPVAGKIYVGNGASVEVFGSTLVRLPDVEAKAANEVKRTTATLNGTISAAGGPEADCEFQYTTEGDPNFESATSVPCSPAGPFTGTAVETVKAEISGLNAQSAYRFRVVGSNENGVNSSALGFETAPAVNLKLDPVSNLTPTSATLNGTINPEGLEVEECSFLSTIEGLEVVPLEESPAEIGAGEAPVPVHANVSGLDPNTTYFYLLRCKNSLGESETEAASFETFGPPLVSDEFPTNITGSTATLTGRVNPRGEATTYAFEYVSDGDFQIDQYAQATSVPVPPEAIGSGTNPVEVSQPISGLAAQTTYHFRLVASNAAGSVQGDDAHFNTFSGPDVLADGRAYEMVSPSQKRGEVVPPEPGARGSCDIPCLPGINNQGMPMQSAPDGNSVLYVGQPFSEGLASGSNEYFAQRSPSGWPFPQGLSLPSITGYYAGFSSDLSRGVLAQVEPALSPAAPVQGGKAFANLYLREPSGFLQPLVKAEPPHRSPGKGVAEAFRVFYAGANSGTGSEPAFSHIVFEANDALTPVVPTVAPEAPEVDASQSDLYEWSEAQLRLVNVLPGNGDEAVAGAVVGSGRLLSVDGPSADGVSAVDNAISADGSRIFWSEESTGQTYLRIDGEETVEIPDSAGTFLTAATDGSKVLLSDGHLYGDLEAEPPSLEADLSQGEGGFKGILGASEDLSTVYFVDTAVLPGAGENQDEGEAQAGAFNLYVWDEGVTTFVGIPGDEEKDWRPSRSSRTAQVSPDGSFLAFMSNASGTKEVYEYAADSASLICASCNATGQEPLGPSNLSLLKASIALPPLRQPANLSPEGEGRLFFESQDVLSPRDTNGRIQDVYEWEPNGVGSCQRAEGCVSLISSGHSSVDSLFLDSSASGDDAFFVTREQLLPRDKDDQLDLYDARVGGGFPETTTPICVGKACRDSTPPAPTPQGAGTTTFSGPGNPKHHKKKHHKKHKHKKHHKKKHHKQKENQHGGGK